MWGRPPSSQVSGAQTEHLPTWASSSSQSADPVSNERNPQSARPDGAPSGRLPTLAPDPDPGELRSRFDPAEGIVYFNDAHADYLLVKDSEPMLLDYLATLVAKEYVVYNNPRAWAGRAGGGTRPHARPRSSSPPPAALTTARIQREEALLVKTTLRHLPTPHVERSTARLVPPYTKQTARSSSFLTARAPGAIQATR